MKGKLFILLAILLSATPAIFFIYDGVADWFSIVRATLIFTIIALVLSPLFFIYLKELTDLSPILMPIISRELYKSYL